jgi:hypothetical protein
MLALSHGGPGWGRSGVDPVCDGVDLPLRERVIARGGLVEGSGQEQREEWLCSRLGASALGSGIAGLLGRLAPRGGRILPGRVCRW